jgi:hypothetical protein
MGSAAVGKRRRAEGTARRGACALEALLICSKGCSSAWLQTVCPTSRAPKCPRAAQLAPICRS